MGGFGHLRTSPVCTERPPVWALCGSGAFPLGRVPPADGYARMRSRSSGRAAISHPYAPSPVALMAVTTQEYAAATAFTGSSSSTHIANRAVLAVRSDDTVKARNRAVLPLTVALMLILNAAITAPPESSFICSNQSSSCLTTTRQAADEGTT